MLIIALHEESNNKQTYASSGISIGLFIYWELTICFEIETKF